MILSETKEYISNMLSQLGGSSFLLMVGHTGPIIISYDNKKYEHSAIIKLRAVNNHIVSMRMIYCSAKDLYKVEYLNVMGDVISSEDDLLFDDMENSVRKNVSLESKTPISVFV